MQQCANCGHQNRAGIVFCENCGASLIGKMPLDTKSLDSSSDEEKAQIGVEVSVLKDVQVQGGDVFEKNASLRLDIQGSPDPILFKPKPETIFGRRDPATGAMPDIDLTPFAGYRMGVSRRHAAIRAGDQQSLDLWDLGSSNGTFLNGEQLSPHRPYRLHDGDEIRLGSMSIRLYFQHDSRAPEKPQPSEQAQPAEPAATDANSDSAKTGILTAEPPAAAQPDQEQPPPAPDKTPPLAPDGQASEPSKSPSEENISDSPSKEGE